jgi:hypothetical protein
MLLRAHLIEYVVKRDPFEFNIGAETDISDVDGLVKGQDELGPGLR